ncbi:MAG: tryptophan 2,3-dioxygenase family protein [Chitinophagales bacterium]|nr:tryptophan 2,3-dioxygenase family protein [Chitinophagales bacterium]HPR28187.1 tryptophan 2,3-dioxygenase family protein [Chitinophagales bacterium]HQU39327.1 tryptophan 2,3-dioxygenase family protein [Chitinophagales bacterium]HQU77098.1 tryptophan 2,3-dioxygenase family protein [Chitinophagales bacterium]HRX22712.1 tryptophan 2,3-dioxygenase family protein [Chitinophagales bacterium]
MSRQPVEYTEYLQLEKILHAQEPESFKEGTPAHDEMLFIIIHQAYELWFKQIHFELDSAIRVMLQEEVNDNSPALQTIVHRTSRIVTILKVLVQQIDILETMTPLDFHDFRDLLRPASGFQSWQFKMLEARLGLKFDHRYGQEYYLSQLKPQYVDLIKKVEAEPTWLELLERWLVRMPFFADQDLWQHYQSITKESSEHHVFWNDYREVYRSTLSAEESGNADAFDRIFLGQGEQHTTLSPAAMRAALFIKLYSGYPILQQPFQMIQNMLDIDEQMATWRFRHINMVHRMIGSRVGTGGSTGKEYLQGALNKHYVFRDFALLSSFLIERKRLPELSPELQKRLGFWG